MSTPQHQQPVSVTAQIEHELAIGALHENVAVALKQAHKEEPSADYQTLLCLVVSAGGPSAYLSAIAK